MADLDREAYMNCLRLQTEAGRQSRSTNSPRRCSFRAKLLWMRRGIFLERSMAAGPEPEPTGTATILAARFMSCRRTARADGQRRRSGTLVRRKAGGPGA